MAAARLGGRWAARRAERRRQRSSEGAGAARRAERRRLRDYENRRGGSAVTQFFEKTRTVAEKQLPIF